MRDELTQFRESPRAGRGGRRARAVTLASAAVLAGGLAVAVSAPAAFAVGTTPSTTSITSLSPPGTQTAGRVFTVNVSVKPQTGTGTPTGSVTVSDGAGHTCTATLTNGSGSCQLTETAGGQYTLTATYGGDATYAGSQGTSGVTVDAAPQFVTDSPPLTAIGGLPYSYTFTASGYPAPSYSLDQGAPGWLSINSTTGAVSGTVPPGTRFFRYSVTATNSVGHVTAGPFNVRVPQAPPARANLSVRLWCPSQVKVHKTGTCWLTVKNFGPGPANHVVAVVSLSPGLGKTSCSPSCFGRGNVVAWNDGTLASYGSVTQSVTFIAWRRGVAVVHGAADSAGWNGNPHGSQAVARIFVR